MENLFAKTHSNNSNKTCYFLIVQLLDLPRLHVSVLHFFVSEHFSLLSIRGEEMQWKPPTSLVIFKDFSSVLVFANKTDFVSGEITPWVWVTMTTPWGAAIPTAVHVLPLLSFLLPIFSSPFPQSSLAATAEISFLWLHMCVTQMWGICSDASGQDEYQQRAGLLGCYRMKTWSSPVSVNQILLELPLI